MYTQKIFGMRIAGYRSFGPERQVLAPFKRVNLLVGQNNSGKSNVLRFIHNHYALTGSSNSPQNNRLFPQQFEHFGGHNEREIRFDVAVPLEHPVVNNVFSTVSHTLRHAIVSDSELVTDGLIFIPYFLSVRGLTDAPLNPYLTNSVIRRPDANHRQWMDLAERGERPEQALLQTIGALKQSVASNDSVSPVTYLIPQFRELKPERLPEDAALMSLNGQHAIDLLAQLQNPGTITISSPELRQKREQFQRITTFFRTVVDSPDATIQVSYDRQTIIVDLEGRVSALENLGAGLHQLMIIAIITTYFDKVVFCIEEPELHMHPTLQKRLVNYLAKNTNNQYFITTHSASLIDVDEDAAIFHITHDKTQSHVTAAPSPEQRRAITDDLGLRASDLLQTNSLIWVEGPSDRIYLNKLIQMLSDGKLRENVHYGFAMYGGAVRASLQLNENPATDSDFNNLLAILPLNRNAVMVADSDKDAPNAPVTDKHKERLEEEFNKLGCGIYWETEGRTIENYIDDNVLDDARRGAHPESKFHKLNSMFAKAMVIVGGSGKEYGSNKKVAIARAVVKEDDPFKANTNIKERGAEIVQKIREWNGIRS